MPLNFSMSLMNEKFYTQSWPFYARKLDFALHLAFWTFFVNTCNLEHFGACNPRYCFSFEILNPFFQSKTMNVLGYSIENVHGSNIKFQSSHCHLIIKLSGLVSKLKS